MLPIVPPVLILYAAALLVPLWIAHRVAETERAEGRRTKRPLLIAIVGILGAVGGATLVKPWTWQVEWPLHTYGLMLATGFLAALVVAARAADKSGLNGNHVWDAAFTILLWGLIGARLLFILVNLDQYFGPNFLSWVTIGGRQLFKFPTILIFWKGGLVFYGGLIGGFAAVVYYLRKHDLPFFPYADALALGVPLAHFFGRLGCFSAGCCWGKACDVTSPFATYFPEGSLAFAQTDPSTHVEHLGRLTTQAIYPTQLFEALGVLLIFGGLLWVLRNKRFHGQVLISYLIAYPLFRTVNETFRGDWERGLLFRWPADNPVMLSTSQIISVGVAALGIYFVMRRLKAVQRAEEARAPQEKAA